jgi:hypothetical protein
MDSLTEIIQQVMLGYAGEALNGYSYLTSSADQDVFTVVSVGKVRDERVVNTGLLVRLVHDRIIIERDINSKPLVDALMQAGIPREQIILAYAGESVPEPI